MLKTPLKKKKKWWRKQNNDKKSRLKCRKYRRQEESRCRRIPIKAPAGVCFHKNLEQTLKFFNDLRGLADTKKLFSIEFEHLSYMSAEASLVLVSEVDRLRCLKNSKIRLSNTKHWKEHIKIQFNEIGMFDLLNIDHRPKDVKKYESKKNDSDVTFLKFISGETADPGKGTQIITSLQELVRDKMSGKKYLQSGLGEAMTNVVQHAYPDDFIKESKFKSKKWWVSASFNKNTSILTFMIYDQGKTIPGTLKIDMIDTLKYLKSFALKFNIELDSHKTRAAVETSKSSTNKKNRGKGLTDIKKYAENVSKGELTIISRKGYYSYKKDVPSEIKELPIPLKGTLIYWRGCMDGKNIDKMLYKNN